MTLVVMAALVLGILAFWALGRARKRMDRDVPPPPGEASETLTVEDNDPIKREVMRNRDRDLAKPGAAAAAGQDEGEGEAPARDVTPEDRIWLQEQMEADEAERAKFLPMLDEFTPLEYDAVRAFRALMQDRVPSGFRPKLAPPAGGGERTVVDAGPRGLTLEAPGGERTDLAWGDLSVGEAFRIAREMTPPDAPKARARHLVYLAQLATLAGEPRDASEFRSEAAALHFRAALGEGAPEEAKALFETARSLVDARSASPPERESDRDALALDILHLSRLASSAGLTSDGAEYAAQAVALDPLLEDEVAGRASRLLDRWLLEDESWAWDPDDTSGADVRTANDFAGDARAILHLYRYMRTLGPDRLARAARDDPSYERLLGLPRQTRGRIYRAECGFIKRHTTMRFTKRPEHLDAGIRELDFLFLSAKDSPGGIYLVCVPYETRFKQGDFLSVTGVYLRRWPYQKPSGKWKWIPWIVASKIEKIEIRGVKGWGAFIFVLLGLGAAGAIALFFAARREWRELTASRDRLHARRLGGRDMIRRKVAGAMAASRDKAKPTDGDKAKPAPEDASKDAAESKEPPDPDAPAPDGDEKKD